MLSLYATRWGPDTARGTRYGSGSVTLNPPGGVYEEGTEVTLTALPEAGWQFSGWSGEWPDQSGKDDNGCEKKYHCHVYGTAANLFTLNVTINGAGSVALEPPGDTYRIGTPVTVTAVPDHGQQFEGWNGSLNGLENLQTLTMWSDKSVMPSLASNRLATNRLFMKKPLPAALRR